MMKTKSLKKNALLNVIKQLCTIIFPLITFPYAARVLHADNYGVYTFSASIVSYFTLLAGLGIANYAVREGARFRNDQYKINYFSSQVFLVNIISTIISFLLLLLLSLIWKKLDAYQSVIWVLSLGIIFTTIGTDWINVIYEDYAYISIRYIVCQLISVILLFFVVRNENDVINYAFITILGTILANISNFVYVRKKYHIRFSLVFSKDILTHLSPILILFGSMVAQTIYINSDVTILGIISNDNAVGIYGVSAKIYLIIKGIANAAIYVIIPRVSALIEQKKSQEYTELYKSTLGNVLIITVPAVIGMMLLSDEIVLLVAGDNYTSAGTPLFILSGALLFAVISCFYVNGMLIPFRKERAAFLFTLISAVINIILNFALIPHFDYNAAAITTLISELIICICAIFYCKKLCRMQITREIIISVVSGAIVLICCCLTKIFIQNYIVRIFVSIVFSVLLYFLFLSIAKNNFVYDFITTFKKRRFRK